MLLASWFVETVGQGFGTFGAVLCVLILCAKKFANGNPEVKDAAKKAAAAKAIQMIARLFK
jgi:hypothetical protein